MSELAPNLVRHLLLSTLAMLTSVVTLLSIGIPSEAAPARTQVQLVVAYAYDSPVLDEPSHGTASERGPPVGYDRTTTHDAVDRWSHGALARHNAAAAAATTTYTTSAGFVTGTTEARVQADVGPESLVQRSGVAANKGDDVVRALSATERRTLDDALRPDKLDHVFDPKHNFGPLVQRFGSRENAMEQIVRNIGGPLPASGPFRVARSIGGQTVIIRGAVVDGTPRIGTAFTP